MELFTGFVGPKYYGYAMAFKFVDLFAGIGGFHAAMGAMGGECVYASEWDKDAARIYERNWGMKPAGDITVEANDEVMKVPPHDVLLGGFPCQPFSKSGKQLGMEETRGTLFWNIAKIIEMRKPSLVLLENVRNLAGPRHIHEWEVIINTLRTLGYRVSSHPLIVSPQTIHPDFGGRPQVRERVFIAATRIPAGVKKIIDVDVPDLSVSKHGWDPQEWKLSKDLPLDKLTPNQKKEVALTDDELIWLNAWNEFVEIFKNKFPKDNLPGFPIWADEWVHINELVIPRGTPDWKENFLTKNAELYTGMKKELDKWKKRWNNLEEFPPSRRKLEWQAQDTKTLWDTVMHFRPSGIRVKKPTYLPALVAITQTSIIAKQKRRITVREAARLQGFPEWFDFLDQRPAQSYKQLGNAVNVGVVFNVLRAQVIRDLDLLTDKPKIVRAILGAPANPDHILGDHATYHAYVANLEEVNLPEAVQLKLA